MDQLHHRLRELKQRIWRLAVCWSTAVLIASCLGTLLLVGVIDWLWRSDAVWMRWGLTIAWLLSVVGAAVWWVGRIRRSRLDDLDLALMIERSDPSWKGELAAAAALVERCEKEVDRGESESFARQHIESVVARLPRRDLESLVSVRETVGVVALVAVQLGLIGVLCGIDPASVGTALARITGPTSRIDWPRRTELVLLDAERQPLEGAPDEVRYVPHGVPVTFFVTNQRGALPDDTALLVRVDGRRLRRIPPGGRRDSGEETAAVTFSPEVGRFEIRARGDDDREMPWHAFESVPPVKVRETVVEILPPDYTGRAARELPAWPGLVSEVVGTRIRIEVRTDRPLETVRWTSATSPGDLTLAEDGQGYTAEFRIESAGRGVTGIELVDAYGLRGAAQQRFEFLGLEDRVPNVELVSPSESQRVVPHAELPLVATAVDDFAIRSLLIVGVEEGGSNRQFELNAAHLGDALATESKVESVWSVASASLEVGTRLRLQALANDWRPHDGEASGESLAGHTIGERYGRSNARTIEVVSVEEKRQELYGRRAGLAAQMEALRTLQEQGRQLTRDVAVRSGAVGQLQTDHFLVLRDVEQTQQELREMLLGTKGLAASVLAMRDEIAWNRLQDEELEQQLAFVGEELSRVGSSLVPEIERRLAELLRRAGDAREEVSAFDGDREQLELAAIQQAQSGLSQAYGDLIEILGVWQRTRTLVVEADELEREFSELQEMTRRIGRTTLARDTEALPASARADLAALADRHVRMATQVDELLEKLKDSTDSEDRRPREALRLLKERLISASLREAAAQAKRNNLGRVAEQHEGIAATLRELAAIVRGAAMTPQDALAEILRARDEILEFRMRQEGIRRRAESFTPRSAASNPELMDGVRGDVERLAEDATRLGRSLRRWGAAASSEGLDRAARRLRETVLQDELAASERWQRLHDEADQEFRDSLRQLDSYQQQMESRLLADRLNELESQGRALAGRQQRLMSETHRLDELREATGRLSRGQLKTLQELSESQRGLAEEVAQLDHALGGVGLLDEAVSTVEQEMLAAAARLGDRETAGAVERHQAQAHRQLLEVADAVGSVRRLGAGRSSAQASSSGDDEASGGLLPLARLVELQLILDRQRDLQNRTAEVIANRSLSESERAARVQQLAEEQAHLVSWLARLQGSQTVGDDVPEDRLH